ncbi:MAG: anti-sigma factor [Bacteroidota bacterium]
MDIKAYIESGILEQYVLGKVTETERLEVEQYAAQYPEIKAELDAIEIAMEEFAMAQQISPMPGGIDKIMARIEEPPAPKSFSVSNIGAIISLLLLAALAIYQFNKLRLLEQENQESKLRIDNLIAERDLCNTNLRQLNIKTNLLRAEGNIPVAVKGQAEFEEAIVNVHWNRVSNESYLDIVNLPPPAQGKQYQLWAIIDGKPTDMGPLDRDLTTDNFITIPHFEEEVQAFAISEEPLGGSPDGNPSKVIMVGPVLGS